MRADGDVESFGKMRDLEPRRDAADARAVDLHDRAGAALEIFAEMRRVVERFADGDRHRRDRGELDVTAEILGRQRLLEPREDQRRERVRAAARLGDGERLVRVDHDLERIAGGFADGGKARDVLGDRRPADLDLRAAKSLRLRGARLVDELLARMVQPAAFRGVDRHARLRAAREDPQRQVGAAALQVPQRRVDRRECQTGDRADGRRVRVEEEILPETLDLARHRGRSAAARDDRAAAPRPRSRPCRSCTCIRCPPRRRRR